MEAITALHVSVTCGSEWREVALTDVTPTLNGN